MKNFNPLSAILSGLIATTGMTMLMVVAPSMGFPEMDIAKMLSGFMGAPVVVGWIAHGMIGLVLAASYALFFEPRTKMSRLLSGMVFGLIPWLVAQTVMMPMMGMGLFSGSMMMAGGSLMGHLIYGAVLGLLYRPRFDSVSNDFEPNLSTKGHSGR